MQVQAAFARGQNMPIALATFDLDGPRAGEVLIEMKAAGLCHSDMSFFNGSRAWSDYPIVLGHEGAGVVRECGPGVTSVAPGDHVIPVGIPECGDCPACRSGKTNLCDQYFQPSSRRTFVLDGRPVRAFCELGTFSKYIVVREIQVTKIRADAPLDVVCCLGCAGATGLGAAIFTARMESNTSAVVFGLGGIGLNVVEGARLAGASMIIGIDVNPSAQQRSRSGRPHQGTDWRRRRLQFRMRRRRRHFTPGRRMHPHRLGYNRNARRAAGCAGDYIAAALHPGGTSADRLLSRQYQDTHRTAATSRLVYGRQDLAGSPDLASPAACRDRPWLRPAVERRGAPGRDRVRISCLNSKSAYYKASTR